MEERFVRTPWQALATGSPALTDALVNFDCRIAQTHDIGSHSIFYCEVERVRQGDLRGAGLFQLASSPGRRRYQGWPADGGAAQLDSNSSRPSTQSHFERRIQFNLNVYLPAGHSAAQKEALLTHMSAVVADSPAAPIASVRIFLIGGVANRMRRPSSGLTNLSC